MFVLQRAGRRVGDTGQGRLAAAEGRAPGDAQVLGAARAAQAGAGRGSDRSPRQVAQRRLPQAAAPRCAAAPPPAPPRAQPTSVGVGAEPLTLLRHT